MIFFTTKDTKGSDNYYSELRALRVLRGEKLFPIWLRLRRAKVREVIARSGGEMNVNDFALKKTALLFFDILNGYVPEPEAGIQ